MVPWSCHLFAVAVVHWRSVIVLLVLVLLIWRVLRWKARREGRQQFDKWLKSESLVVKAHVIEALTDRLKQFETNGYPQPFVRVDAMRDEMFDKLELADMAHKTELWDAVKQRITDDSRVEENQHAFNHEVCDTWQLVRA